MAIDGAVSQTAVEAWDKRWATSEGRADWLEPHPAVVAILPELHARGARRVLDLGCGVGRHALLLAEHGFDVEAIDGSPAGLAVVRETAAARGLPVSLRQASPTRCRFPTPASIMSCRGTSSITVRWATSAAGSARSGACCGLPGYCR